MTGSPAPLLRSTLPIAMSQARSTAEGRAQGVRRSAFDTFDEMSWLSGVRGVLSRALGRAPAPSEDVVTVHPPRAPLHLDSEESDSDPPPEDPQAKAHMKLTADAMRELMELGGIEDADTQAPVTMEGFADQVWRVEERSEPQAPSSLLSAFQVGTNGPIDFDALLRYRAESADMPERKRPMIEVVSEAQSQHSDSEEEDEIQEAEGDGDENDEDTNTAGHSWMHDHMDPTLPSFSVPAETENLPSLWIAGTRNEPSMDPSVLHTQAEGPCTSNQARGRQDAPIVVLSDSESAEDEPADESSYKVGVDEAYARELSSVLAMATQHAQPTNESMEEDHWDEEDEEEKDEDDEEEKEEEDDDEEDEEDDDDDEEQVNEDCVDEHVHDRPFQMEQVDDEPFGDGENLNDKDQSHNTQDDNAGEALVEEVPVEEAPVEEVQSEVPPIEEDLVEETPVEEAPVEETPAEETPAEEAPVEETPVDSEAVVDQDDVNDDEEEQAASSKSDMARDTIFNEEKETQPSQDMQTLDATLMPQEEASLQNPAQDEPTIALDDDALDPVSYPPPALTDTLESTCMDAHPTSMSSATVDPSLHEQREPSEAKSPTHDASSSSSSPHDTSAPTLLAPSHNTLGAKPDNSMEPIESPRPAVDSDLTLPISLPASPHTTRSHCPLQRVTLTRAVGAPTFLVRSCTLNPSILKEEAAESEEVLLDSLDMRRLDADALPEDVYHSLCRIVGTSLLDDVYVLPDSLGDQWMKQDSRSASPDVQPSPKRVRRAPTPPRRMRLRTAQERRPPRMYSPDL